MHTILHGANRDECRAPQRSLRFALAIVLCCSGLLAVVTEADAICGRKSCVVPDDWRPPRQWDSLPRETRPATIPTEQVRPAAPDPALIQRQEGASLNDRGNSAWNAGDLESAVNLYRQALVKLPGDSVVLRNLAGALNHLGNTAFSRKDYGVALAYYQEALRNYPAETIFRNNLAAALNGLGWDAYGKGDPGRARDYFQQAMVNNPDSQIYKNNYLGTVSNIEWQRNEQERRSKEAEALGASRDNIRALSDSLAGSAAGKPDFDGRKAGSPAAAGGLDFMPARPSGSTQALPPTDASVVDLRFLDPEKPVVLDPAVVKGKPRMIPVQRSDNAQADADYQKGFDALRGNDPRAALVHFQRVQAALPNDPLVKNAIALAQDILRTREQKAEKVRDARALDAWFQGYSSLQDGDVQSALAFWKEAHAISPGDPGFRDTLNFLEGIQTARQQEATKSSRNAEEQRLDQQAVTRAFDSIVPLAQNDYRTAIQIIRDAKRLRPENQELTNMLLYVEMFLMERARDPEAAAKPPVYP